MRTVVVVGGGLAGMVAARELALTGRKVVILEQSERLGGKAGADTRTGRPVEHGYHVFPKWYPNVRALLDEIQVKLVDFDRYHYLVAGGFPSLVTVRGPTSIGAIIHNTLHGLLPWYQTLLFFNFTLDMLSQPLSAKKLLDKVSTVGLMRQAWYMTEQVAELNQENMLKASAIPAIEMNAMTAKKIGGFWVRQADPFLSVMPGDLQSTFIEPLARLVRDAGVEVRLGTEVVGQVKEGRVAAVHLRDGSTLAADTFVLATPFEITRQWIDDSVYPLDPSLGNLQQLESKPMAAIHVRLKRKLENIPREHVFFHGGEYGLSFIDVSQIWPDVPATELSFIASNYGPLAALSDAAAEAALLSEIREYLPIAPEDIESIELQSNLTTPLFINTIGAWANRPKPRTQIPNVYIAGDFVQNEIDLACMEGAVSSAISAANAILHDQDGTHLKSPAVPPVWPRPLLLAARVALLPSVALAYAIARIAESLGAKPPPASKTRTRSRRRPAR
ncbi:MAG: FAD-dependent oxidoreductase [Polyangiaceae bacterium]